MIWKRVNRALIKAKPLSHFSQQTTQIEDLIETVIKHGKALKFHSPNSNIITL